MSNKGESTAEAGSGAALVPKLRFPEFRDAAGWEKKPLSTGLDYLQPTPYLVSDTSYSPAYSTPVLTAGKTFILGYTNEEHGIFRDGLPVIIFDDFTTASQFVDFPFKAKSSAMKILQAKNGSNIKFMFEALQMLSFEAGSHERHWISVFAPMLVPVPKSPEQQKIAECLDSVDALIAAQGRKVEALSAHKKGLMQQLFPQEGETQPRLRFPEFEGAGEWEEAPVEDVILTVTPPKKIPTSDYQAEGALPIIDQSQDLVSGWTNDGEALIDKGLPVIVFGDHTCCLKFISTPFAQGADGIKIIRPKRGISTRFLFYALEANPVVQDGYKRHFSVLKEKIVLFPDPKSGEQQHIADCLSSLDDLIAAEAQKLATLKTHKKGLMQQLFPQVGEE